MVLKHAHHITSDTCRICTTTSISKQADLARQASNKQSLRLACNIHESKSFSNFEIQAVAIGIHYWLACKIFRGCSQFKESLSFLSGPIMKTARIVKGRSWLSLLFGSSIPSANITHSRVADFIKVLGPQSCGRLIKHQDCRCYWQIQHRK